jgi:hypothetical protein
MSPEQIAVECGKIKSYEEHFIKYVNILHYVILYSSSPKISSEIYKILSRYYDTPEKHKQAINHFLFYANIDEGFVSTMLECSHVIPDSTFVNSVLSNAKYNKYTLFTKIIDALVMYGLIMTKDIVITCLKYKCAVRSIERYNTKFDEDMYLVCAKENYYPYTLNFTPTDKIIHAELEKPFNIKTAKVLKELGAIFNTCCLEVACSTNNSSQVIKYLINELGVKPSNTCVRNLFLNKTMDVVSLDTLLEPKELAIQKVQPKPKKLNKKIILNPNSTLKITPKQIIKKDQTYKLKSRVRKFFNQSVNSINYTDLYKVVLQYLITNNLVIGNYFVINPDLSKLLKLSESVVLYIDELDNIISYFIEEIL